jgi:hypothetical protein
MLAAFRSSDARTGGERFSRSSPFPDVDSMVVTFGDAVFDGPWSGETYDAGRPRDLFVDGRVEIRGPVRMEGWRIWAKGQVVVQDEAELVGVSVFAESGVRLSDKASLSGQILATGSVILSQSARLVSPSFAAVWQGKGADSVAKIHFEDESKANAYVVAQGGTSEVRVDRRALFQGVVVSGGNLLNAGRIQGVAAASGILACGPAQFACSEGGFDRGMLPPDFVFPLGLPGNRGVRLVSWSLL